MKPIIDISLLELIKSCKNDGEDELELFRAFKGFNGNYVQEIFGVRKYGYNFTDRMSVYSDGESLGSIRPSYNDFFETICSFLGVEYEKSFTEKKLTRLLEGRVKKLKTIDNEIVLAKEFPRLNVDFNVGRSKLRKLHGQKRYGRISEEVHDEIADEHFYKCGIKININKFVDDQVDVYSKFIERREDYKNLISEKSYDKFISEHFNPDKVALFLAYNYLEACDKATPKEKEVLLGLIYQYLSSDYDKSISIKLPDREISIADIHKRVSGMKKDLVVHVDWAIMPVKKHSTVNRGSSGTSERRTIVLTKDEVAEITRKGQLKNDYYDKSDYLQMLVGKDNKYVEYIFPNGIIVKDVRFNPNNIKGTRKGAAFSYYVTDYDELKGKDPTFLEADPRVVRYVHQGDWMDRIDSVIKREATEKDKGAVKKFLKRI